MSTTGALWRGSHLELHHSGDLTGFVLSTWIAANIVFPCFHLARMISSRRAVCLSGLIPEFLPWPPSDFALQNCCSLGQTLRYPRICGNAEPDGSLHAR